MISDIPGPKVRFFWKSAPIRDPESPFFEASREYRELLWWRYSHKPYPEKHLARVASQRGQDK